MVSIESTDMLYCIHKGDKCMYSSITDTSITVFYNGYVQLRLYRDGAVQLHTADLHNPTDYKQHGYYCSSKR